MEALSLKRIRGIKVKWIKKAVTDIKAHYKKTALFYDSIGRKSCFLLIYARNPNFIQIWEDYIELFESQHFEPIVKDKPFKNWRYNSLNHSEIKIGKTEFLRSGQIREMIHIMVNLYC
jgi:hypothetical protein